MVKDSMLATQTFYVIRRETTYVYDKSNAGDSSDTGRHTTSAQNDDYTNNGVLTVSLARSSVILYLLVI